MKTPSKILSVLLASAVFLTACGDDKPAEPAPKDEPKQEVKAEPATNSAQPSEPKTKPQADDKASEVKAEDTAKTDDKADNQENPKADEPKKDEAKPETKTEVQALSIEEGKARYEKTCKICHEQGLLNAPKLTDKANWEKRLAKGIDTLHTHSAKGFGKMPAQVTDEVSEAEVYAAVDYMVSQVK